MALLWLLASGTAPDFITETPPILDLPLAQAVERPFFARPVPTFLPLQCAGRTKSSVSIHRDWRASVALQRSCSSSSMELRARRASSPDAGPAGPRLDITPTWYIASNKWHCVERRRKNFAKPLARVKSLMGKIRLFPVQSLDTGNHWTKEIIDSVQIIENPAHSQWNNGIRLSNCIAIGWTREGEAVGA